MATTIAEIEVLVLNAPNEVRPHWGSLFKVPSANELLVRLRTNDGIEGFGLATSYTDIAPIVNVFKNGLADEIVGLDPLAPERVYQKLLALLQRAWQPSAAGAAKH
jgi:L-alanine-DL-glutamate epimerase-like enolase superfamily enzyme